MAQGPWDTGTWDSALWDNLPITGSGATGSAGSVGSNLTIALVGVKATGAVGSVTYVPPPLILDTHDGDYHKKLKELFDEQNQRDKRKREDIIAAYERIVEGKPDVAKELTSGFEVKNKGKYNKYQVITPNIDFDKFIKDLDRVEKLWNQYLDMEDEDLMALL
jgi:hypothetical protein